MNSPVILITGFEPFGGSSLNPSEQVAKRLNGEQVGGWCVQSRILPVERQRGPAALLRALEETQPQAAICLGEAGDRATLCLERVAINLLDYRIPDNQGETVLDEPVRQDGPAAYFTTLPVRKMLHVIRQAGVPAILSQSAGTYLCNQVMYELLHALAVQGINIPAGFIHLPSLPEQASLAERIRPSMDLGTMLHGIRAAIQVLPVSPSSSYQ